ncbi:MAG TPA: cysteine desulfurase family protein [Lachnospiraceae bacterium]|nr:cysteine desulfurase family protein [Lachnospiraceae bacterium]
MIYLDYAANTPVAEEVLDCFVKANRDYYGNPNSTHKLGVSAKEQMDSVTADIAQLLKVKQAEVIYTSGSSESNNLAIKGVAFTYRQKGKHIISTCLEHSSVSGALTSLQNQGYEIDLVDILPNGQVDIEHLSQLIRNDTILVSVSYVDSELGVIQPIKEIASLLENRPNCLLHVDATQAVGKIPIELDGIDLFSFTPHKFFGINGSGILIRKENVILEPLIHGGASTTIYRSGTPAFGLAAAIRRALELAILAVEERYSYVEELNGILKEALRKYPLVRFNSTDRSVPHILNLSVKGVKGTQFQQALAKLDICVSVKSACSVTNTASRPVYAVSKDKKNAMCSWRISLSHVTTKEEIDQFLEAFDKCYNEFT